MTSRGVMWLPVVMHVWTCSLLKDFTSWRVKFCVGTFNRSKTQLQRQRSYSVHGMEYKLLWNCSHPYPYNVWVSTQICGRTSDELEGRSSILGRGKLFYYIAFRLGFGALWGYSSRGMKLLTHLCLVPGLRMRGAYTQFVNSQHHEQLATWTVNTMDS
jgi:hypothetical protein